MPEQYGAVPGPRGPGTFQTVTCLPDFPGGSVVKESTCQAGDVVQSLSQGYPLEREMATHPSILAWEIPWTEEPGGLQSMQSQRVRYDLATTITYLLGVP